MTPGSPLQATQVVGVPVSCSDLASSPSSTALTPLMDRHIQRFIYLALASDPKLWTPKYMEEWEESTRQRNLALGVSGFMLYSPPYFFEVLEGFPEVIGPLFHTIRRDPRYERCLVLGDMHCVERRYPGWNAHGVTDTAALQVMLPTLLGQISQAFLSMWKYFPRHAADLMLQGKDPRLEPPDSREVVIAFVQIVEFPALLKHPALKGYIADMLSKMFDISARASEASGGRVAKVVNGTILLYWPAVAAAAAYNSVWSMAQTLAALRDEYGPYSPHSLVYMRAGLHCGQALLCNVGMSKADITLLGDTINVAAYLALLATTLHARILVSEAVRSRMGDAGKHLEGMGPQQIKGRTQVVTCYRSPGAQLDGRMVLERITCFNGELESSSCPRSPVCDYDQIPINERPPLFHDLLQSSDPAPKQMAGCLTWWASRWRARPPPDPNLITVMYISRASVPLDDAEIHAIHRFGYRRNKGQDLTAELLYVDGLFVQTVEGPAAAVQALWRRLKRDPRHAEVVVVHLARTQRRLCSSPLSLHIMSATEIAAMPVLPEVLGQLLRSLKSLEAYVPYAVVQHVRAGSDPHAMPPARVDINMVAADIVCFTSLSEGSPLTEVWQICTTFIDLCTSAIRDAGGQVIKLIGDCVTAYFPPEAAAAALSAARNLIQICLMRCQYVHPLDCRSVMACAVALDYGPVITASCGSHNLSKYVITGEVSVRVMDVLRITRTAGRKVILTKPFTDRLPHPEAVEPVPSPLSAESLACYALAGPEMLLDVPAIRKSIETYHRACETVCSTPYQNLLPESKSEEQPPLVALMSHNPQKAS
jgi:class 3 adenylate cyclase